MAYHGATNGDLKVARSEARSWSWNVFTLDKGIHPVTTGLYPSLSYGMGVVPNIVYYSSNPSGDDALRLARYVGSGGNCGYGSWAGEWQCDTIQTGEGVGQYPSIYVVGCCSRHIAYYDAANGDLWYATNTTGSNCGPGNSWTCYPVTGAALDVGQYASLYVDSEGHFHIAYYDATNDVLKYAVDVGSGGNCGLFGSAQCDEIDAMMQGYNHLGVSIAEDAVGYPIIAYQSEYGSLNVARPLDALGLPGSWGNCGPEETLFTTWRCETIDRYGLWTAWRNGDYVSIDVDASGLATIAYQRYYVTAGSGNLMVAYQQLLHAFLPIVLESP